MYKSNCYIGSAQTKRDWLICSHVNLNMKNCCPLPSDKCSKRSEKFRKDVFLVYEKNTVSNREEKYSIGKKKKCCSNTFQQVLLLSKQLTLKSSIHEILLFWECYVYFFFVAIYNRTLNVCSVCQFVLLCLESQCFPNSQENKSNYFPIFPREQTLGVYNILFLTYRPSHKKKFHTAGVGINASF